MAIWGKNLKFVFLRFYKALGCFCIVFIDHVLQASGKLFFRFDLETIFLF